jgi:hypothetical protein
MIASELKYGLHFANVATGELVNHAYEHMGGMIRQGSVRSTTKKEMDKKSHYYVIGKNLLLARRAREILMNLISRYTPQSTP